MSSDDIRKYRKILQESEISKTDEGVFSSLGRTARDIYKGGGILSAGKRYKSYRMIEDYQTINKEIIKLTQDIDNFFVDYKLDKVAPGLGSKLKSNLTATAEKIRKAMAVAGMDPSNISGSEVIKQDPMAHLEETKLKKK